MAVDSVEDTKPLTSWNLTIDTENCLELIFFNETDTRKLSETLEQDLFSRLLTAIEKFRAELGAVKEAKVLFALKFDRPARLWKLKYAITYLSNVIL